MYYYFCSNEPVAIKFNGSYFATLGNDVLPCDLQEENLPLIEICPLNQSNGSFAFFLDEKFLSSPPQNISVTDLKGGYLIKIYTGSSNGKFGVYAQSNIDSPTKVTATVFNDGTNKLSIETPSDFYVENLDFSLTNLKVEFYLPDFFNQNLLIVCFSSDMDTLVIYNLENKITKIFQRKVQGFSLEGGFTTYERLKDIAKHTLTTFWTFENGKLNPTNKKIERKEGFCTDKLSEKIIPYVFLEELAVGGAVNDYVTGIIKENLDKLSGFFGDFIGVMPPPLFRNVNEVGLVYLVKENLYKVEYFTFQVENKKIANVTRCD